MNGCGTDRHVPSYRLSLRVELQMKLMTFNIFANGNLEAGDRQQAIQQVIAKHNIESWQIHLFH